MRSPIPSIICYFSLFPLDERRVTLKHQLSNQPHHDADDSDFDDLSDPGKKVSAYWMF